jgi:hypothetical protein
MSVTTEESAAAAIRPFTVEIPEAEIEALRARVAATRWPHKELVDDWSQGVQLAMLQELARYWATDYDWRKCEAELNALPQFKTEIDGLGIHFIHVKSRHENALPQFKTEIDGLGIHFIHVKSRHENALPSPSTSPSTRAAWRPSRGISPSSRPPRCRWSR